MKTQALNDIKLHLPAYHAGQLHVLRNAKKRNIICAHRGWRKSTFLARLCIEHVLNHKVNVAYYMPTGKMIKEIWEEIWKKILSDKIAKFHITDMYIELYGFGRIQFNSLEEPDNLRGGASTLVIGDEYAYADPYTWDSILLPTAIKLRGDVWLVSTLNREDPTNHFYYKLQAWADDNECMSATIPVSAELSPNETTLISKFNPLANPDITYDDITQAFRDTEDKRNFKLEWLCLPIAQRGSQFTHVAEACIVNPISNPNPSKRYLGGIDIGKEDDYTVIIVIDPQTREMVHYERFNKCLWADIYFRCAWSIKQFPGVWKIDTTGCGAHVIEELNKRGARADEHVWNNANKVEYYDHLQALLEQRCIKLWKLPEIITELTSIRRVTSTKYITFSSSKHDDIPGALVLAARQLMVLYGEQMHTDDDLMVACKNLTENITETYENSRLPFWVGR